MQECVKQTISSKRTQQELVDPPNYIEHKQSIKSFSLRHYDFLMFPFVDIE